MKRKLVDWPGPCTLSPDRLVRFLQPFFDELDGQLPDQRGADGSPSATDFLLYELPPIRDLLASGFEECTLAAAGAEPLRVLIVSGTLVRSAAIYAYVSETNSVDVLGIEIQ